MCVYTPDVRPGLAGMQDHLDVILDVKNKVTHLLELLDYKAGTNMSDNDETATVCGLVEDILAHAWTSTDALYDLWRVETKKKEACHG